MTLDGLVVLDAAVPLSAETSLTLKFSAVASTRAGSNLVSLASLSRISTAVTILVLTPHIRWTLTHSCC